MFENLKKLFEKIREEYSFEQNLRESLIKESRDIVFYSKKVIYNVHRNNLIDAEKDFNILRKKTLSFVKKFEDNNISFEKYGFFNNVLQEYVEAFVFFEFVKNKTIPLKESFYDSEIYLLGILDFTGELLRIAVNNAVKNKEFFLLCYNTIVFLHDEFMLFDFPNSNLRKKFDSLKYSVKKLEDIKLQLEIKEC